MLNLDPRLKKKAKRMQYYNYKMKDNFEYVFYKPRIIVDLTFYAWSWYSIETVAAAPLMSLNYIQIEYSQCMVHIETIFSKHLEYENIQSTQKLLRNLKPIYILMNFSIYFVWSGNNFKLIDLILFTIEFLYTKYLEEYMSKTQ